MGKTEIFWFSGTGNSLAAAKDIAVRINAELTPMASLKDKEHISSTAEAVGFVFPVYDFKAPKYVEAFVEKCEGLEDKYVFAVCTYGINPLKCLTQFSLLLARRGAVLRAGFAVMMPHNAVGNFLFSEKYNEKMLAAWKDRVDSVANVIGNRETHPVETSSVLTGMLLNGLFFRMMKPLIPFLLHVARHGWNSLAFTVNDACTGCKTCSRVCPVGNITVQHEKPCWGEDCTGCFACIQWCPREAVQLGTGKIKIRRYQHPEINSSDMDLSL